MHEDHLTHWGLKKGSEADEHKYYKRIDTGKTGSHGQTVYRYFYSKKEWEAYDKSSKAKNNSINAATTNNDFKVSSISKNISNAKNQLSSFVENTLKELSKTIVKNTRKVSKGIAYISDHLKDKFNPKETEKDKTVPQIKNQTQSASTEKEKTDYEKYLDSLDLNLKDKLDLKTREYSKAEDEEIINPGIYRVVDEHWDARDGVDDLTLYAFTTNCAYCSIAYDMRRRGYDVEAKGAYMAKGYYGLGFEDIEECYKNGTFSDFYDVEATNDFNRVVSKISKCGPGSRGILGIEWIGGGGHAVVWEVEKDGRVTIRDAQTNSMFNINEYYSRVDKLTYMRTDNLEPTDTVTKYVRSHLRTN